MSKIYKTKKELIAHTKEVLGRNLGTAERGLMKLYSYQSIEERLNGLTSDENDLGFTKNDAPILTSFAQCLEMGKNLSAKQVAVLFNRMPKYANQLTTQSIKCGLIQKTKEGYFWN